MATQTKIKSAKFDASRYHGLDREALIRIYRAMFLSRRLDDREIQLKRQNKIFFQISGAGHEAVLAAAGLVLKPTYDWFFPHYRDRALMLMLGVTPYEMLLQGVGAKDDPASGGRQMPSHWGHAGLNIFTRSSHTGTQFLPAVGAAEAGAYYEKFPKSVEQARKSPLGSQTAFHCDELVYVSSGEGTTSQGEFYESLNTASNKQLPVLYLIEDNGYAISVPVEVQTAGGSISKLVRNYPHLLVEECDGTDPLASYATLQRAAAHAKGPRWFTRTSPDRIRIHSPMTKSSTAAKTSAPPKRSVTRFQNSPCFWSAKACWKKANSKHSKPRSTAKLLKRLTRRWSRTYLRPIQFMSGCIRPTYIRNQSSSTPNPKSTAIPKPWSKWSRPR